MSLRLWTLHITPHTDLSRHIFPLSVPFSLPHFYPLTLFYFVSTSLPFHLDLASLLRLPTYVLDITQQTQQTISFFRLFTQLLLDCIGYPIPQHCFSFFSLVFSLLFTSLETFLPTCLTYLPNIRVSVWSTFTPPHTCIPKHC